MIRMIITVALAMGAWAGAQGQVLPYLPQQSLQFQPQTMYQQGQLMRQQQIIDNAIGQQQSADAMNRSAAGQIDPGNSSGSQRAKALVDQATHNGKAAMPTPLQLASPAIDPSLR